MIWPPQMTSRALVLLSGSKRFGAPRANHQSFAGLTAAKPLRLVGVDIGPSRSPSEREDPVYAASDMVCYTLG